MRPRPTSGCASRRSRRRACYAASGTDRARVRACPSRTSRAPGIARQTANRNAYGRAADRRSRAQHVQQDAAIAPPSSIPAVVHDEEDREAGPNEGSRNRGPPASNEEAQNRKRNRQNEEYHGRRGFTPLPRTAGTRGTPTGLRSRRRRRPLWRSLGVSRVTSCCTRREERNDWRKGR